MKILYQLEITKETGFTASDFPDRFEILRKDKTPLVFKPCALNVQEMYNRLNEAEEILKEVQENETTIITGENCSATGIIEEDFIKLDTAINEYFDRYSQ